MEARLFLFPFCFIVGIVNSFHHESIFNLELYKSVLNSDLCDKQLQFLLSSPHVLQKFMEANANIPHDLSAKGVLKYTGDYFSCLSIHEHVNGLNVQGKYTLVTVDVPGHINNYKYKEIDNVTWREMRNNFDRRQSIQLPHVFGCKAFPPPDPGYWKASLNTTTITLGVCIPEPCSSAQAIDFVLDTENRPLTLEGKVIQPNYSIQFYRLRSDKPISSADYIFITITVCFILLAITGTVCDIKNMDNLVSTKMMSMFRCFAVHKNIQQLLKVNSSSNTVQCVDGIRAIAMAMIIWRHCNSARIESDLFSYYLIPLICYDVDTFLLLGGIFIVYSTVHKYNKRSFLGNLHLHILNRLVRVYPALCVAVLAQVSIMIHIGDGPQWHKMADQVRGCRLNWWNNLLFIQNIISVCDSGGLNLCLSHTWYLAVDMQLFLVSTLVLMWMFGKKRTAWTALTFAVILSLACSTTFSFLLNFNNPLFSVKHHPEIAEQKYKQNYWTMSRSPPYFVGMMTGYVLIYLRDQKKTINLKKIWIWFLWVLAIFILTLSVAGMTIIWDSINNQVLHNIINSNMMAIWSVAVSWVIIACHLGYGGPVNWFLSLKQWKLLSRLSYSMYIFHVPVLYWMDSIEGDDTVVTKTFQLITFQIFLTAFFASVIIAFITSVLIEQPVVNLYTTLLGGRTKNAKIKTAVEQGSNISNGAVSTLNVLDQEGK